MSVIYRSPSQNINEINLFLSNLEIFLSEINKRKPSLFVVTGDFNVRSSYWWCKDINTTEGLNLFSLTSSNGFSQLLFSNGFSHDLIFTDQPNLSTNAGVHSTLHSNCDHQKVHSSFNLNIYYPPPYQRLTWDYKKAESTQIRKTPDSIKWEVLFIKKDLNA